MESSDNKVRVDKWLWAARFFRTRALAQEAINGGKVHVNGERVKAARTLSIGDRLEITRGVDHLVVDVLELAERRGPAKQAQALYSETPESEAKRLEAAETRRLLKASTPRSEGRPDKKQRRQIIRFKSRD